MPEPKAKRSGMDFAEWKAAWGVRLNDQQEAAVQAAEGPVLLLAVPGSGKTTALIHRLGYLIFCRGVAPEHILTVTYTVSATKDMAARFAQVFGADLAGRLEFRTINGLSARIIRYYEFNCSKEPFNDARVRRALTLALNRKIMLCNFFICIFHQIDQFIW